MAVDVLNPSQESRFTLIEPGQLGQRTEQFIQEADSLEATFYSLERVDPSILKLLQQKGPLGRFIVNYGQKEASDVGPLERQIQILRDTGAEVTEFSEPTRRQRTHSKVYVSEDEFLVSTANPSVGFDQVPDINTFRPSPLRRLGALLGMDSQREIRQINYGITSRDAGLREELRSILNTVRGNEFSLSTDNFITGGRESRSADVIVSRIDQVKKGETILFGSAYMDDPRVILALARAKGRGVDVKGMVNNPDTVYERAKGGQEELVRGGLQYLASKGVTLYAPRRTDALKQHSKFMVLGEEGVIIGSHNFTEAADRDSAEVSLSVNDRDLADQFRTSFEQVIENYGMEKLYSSVKQEQIGEGFLSFQQAEVKASMRDMGITNPNFAYLGTSTHLDDLRAPSALPSSYFYARALYNATQYREGDLASVIRTREVFGPESSYLGAVSSQYKMAMLLQKGRTVESSDLPRVFREYDLALEQGSFGDDLNELTVRLGWGRLYKADVGLLPSALGSVGRVLDSTISYYGAEVPDYLLRVNQIDQVRIEDKSEGPFESLLTTVAENALSGMFSIFTYLITSLPAAVITSKTIGSLMQSSLDAVKRGEVNSLQKFAVQGFSSKTLSEIAADENFFKTGFNFYSLQYNLMRRPGQIMFDKVIRPFIEDIISPFGSTTSEAVALGEALDNFSKESGRQVRVDIEGNNASFSSQGFDREQTLAKSFDKIGDRVPLNPFNWKTFRANNPIPGNYLRVSDIFRLEDALAAVNRVLDPIRKLIPIPQFLNRPNLVNLIEAAKDEVGERLTEAGEKIKTSQVTNSIDTELDKSLKELEHLENKLIKKGVLKRTGPFIKGSLSDPNDESYKDLKRYRELLTKQRDKVRKAAKDLLTSGNTGMSIEDIEASIYRRAADNRSTLNPSSLLESVKKDQYRTVGDRPPKMFLRAIGLTALLAMSIQTAASFVLDAQRSVPQITQMRTQRRLDREGLGLDTEITAAPLFQLPKELDVASRLAYVTGAFALGFYVDSKVHRYQTDFVNVTIGQGEELVAFSGQRFRRRRNIYGVAGGLTTIGAILLPSAVEQTLAGVRKLYRFSQRRQLRPNPVFSQGQVTASNLTLLSQELRSEDATFDEIQAAHQADKLSAMMSFMYEERTRGTSVIAIQAPTPFFQPFFTMAHRGYRDTDTGRVGGAYYFSLGIQAPPILGLGTNLELPFGVTLDRDEENIRKGSVFGLIYNPNENTFTNYFAAIGQVYAFTTVVGGVSRGVAALTSTAQNLEARLAAVDEALISTRILNNAIRFPLYTYRLAEAIGEIGGHLAENIPEMGKSLLKDLKVDTLIPRRLKGRGKGKTLAYAAIGAALGYLLAGEGYLSINEEEVFSELHYDLIGAAVGVTAGGIIGSRSKVPAAAPESALSRGRRGITKGALVFGVTTAVTTFVITDPDFEFMRPLEEEPGDRSLHRLGVGAAMGLLAYHIPYKAMVETSDVRLKERLQDVNAKLAAPNQSSVVLSPLERLKKAKLLQEKNHLENVMQVGLNRRGIGVRYTEELFRRSAPLIFAAGVITILDRYHDRFLEAIPGIGAILQDTFDILRGGRRNEVEPLLRRGLSSAVLVNRDGRIEPVVSSDPRFFRQVNRQPILRAIAQAYYADSPNPFMPLPLTSFGLTFRSRADGMIATPYLQFQAASVDISFSETIMSTMSQSAQRSVLSGGYDVTFETMQIHQTQDKGQKVHHLLNLTASIPPLAKRRSISRPSEMVMSYISSDPLLSYLMQDRARRSASDSYKRPESLYFGIESEAWQTIRSNISPATLNKLTPQDIDKLIYDIINPRGMKQSFNLVPEAQGLGRLRFNSNRDIEDLLILSSPFYEDEVRPMENRLQNFISSALAGVEGAFSFSPILGWAAVGVFGLFSMLAISGMTRAYNYIDSQRLNSNYADLKDRLTNISNRSYTPVTDSALEDAPRFGRKNLVNYKDNKTLLTAINERAAKVKANQQEFIKQVLGETSLTNSSHKTLSQALEELSNLGVFTSDNLNKEVTNWLRSRIENLFSFSEDLALQDLVDSWLSPIHRELLKEQFSTAVSKVVSKEISKEFYKVGGIFYKGALSESPEVIARAISLKFLELVEEPLRQFYDDLAGLLSGVADVSDIETLESIDKASPSPRIQASSTTSAPKVAGAKDTSSLHKITQALYGKSNWAKSLETMGAILGGAISIVNVIEALGIANLGLRISAAYSEDSPTGYINNLVESWSRDFLITSFYGAGGLFNRPIAFMIGALSLTVLDMVLSRYEPYREVSDKAKQNVLYGTSQAYTGTLETVSALSLGIVEEEDVAFGITSVGAIGVIAGAAGTARSFMGIKNIPDWIVHPFQEVGKGTFRQAKRTFSWASKTLRWKPLVNLAAKVARSGRGRKAATVTGLAALGILVVGGLVVAGAAITRYIHGAVAGSSIYRDASRVTQAVTDSVEDRIPFIRMFMPHPMDYLNGYRANSSQNPFLVASPDDAIKMEYLQMLSSAGQDFGGGTVSYFVSSETYGIPNRYSRESKIISQAFEGMGPKRLLDPLLDRMLMMRGQEFDNRVIGQMNWRALIRRAANHRELKKALDNTRESARARRTNTNSTSRRLSEDYNIVLYAAALLKPSNPAPEIEAVKISFAEVPRNTNYDQAALAVEAATGRGQAGSRDVKVRDLGPGNGFEVDITPSQSHLVELAATQYRARQNTMQPTA